MNDITQILERLSPPTTEVVRQYRDGTPDNVSDDDLRTAYRQVSEQLTPDEFQQAAASAYDRLSPEERAEVAQYLRTHAEQSGIPTSYLPSATTAATDPGSLATGTAEVNGQDTNMLQDMFAPDGIFSSPVAKAALLGFTAFAAQALSKRF